MGGGLGCQALVFVLGRSRSWPPGFKPRERRDYSHRDDDRPGTKVLRHVLTQTQVTGLVCPNVPHDLGLMVWNLLQAWSIG